MIKTGLEEFIQFAVQAPIKKPATYVALVILGGQDDLIEACGQSKEFFNRITGLVQKWRDRAGYVIWVRLTGPQNQPDLPKHKEEIYSLFQTLGPPLKQVPQPSDYSPAMQKLIDCEQDIQLTIPNGSRVITKPILDILRTEFIDSIYLCGCLTDSIGYRIMSDVGQLACDVHLVEDCIGYKDQRVHQNMMEYLMEQLNANVITSDIINRDLDSEEGFETDNVETETEASNRCYSKQLSTSPISLPPRSPHKRKASLKPTLGPRS